MFKGVQDRSRISALSDSEHESLSFEAEFFSSVLSNRPGYVDAMIPLANALTALGWFEAGLEVDLAICSARPTDEVAHYNLACSYALLCEKEKALSALTRSCKLGYRDFDHLRNDSDLAAIVDDPRFEIVIRNFSSESEGVSRENMDG